MADHDRRAEGTADGRSDRGLKIERQPGGTDAEGNEPHGDVPMEVEREQPKGPSLSRSGGGLDLLGDCHHELTGVSWYGPARKTRAGSAQMGE